MRDPFQSTLYCVKSDGEHGIVVGSAEYSRCVLFDSRNDNNHVQVNLSFLSVTRVHIKLDVFFILCKYMCCVSYNKECLVII